MVRYTTLKSIIADFILSSFYIRHFSCRWIFVGLNLSQLSFMWMKDIQGYMPFCQVKSVMLLMYSTMTLVNRMLSVRHCAWQRTCKGERGWSQHSRFPWTWGFRHKVGYRKVQHDSSFPREKLLSMYEGTSKCSWKWNWKISFYWYKNWNNAYFFIMSIFC